jgi:hypothetical protein
LILALLAAEGRAQSCTGDCDGDSRVELDELIRAVNVALGTLTIDACAALARNDGTGVGIDDLVQAVAGAMSGCAKSEGRDAVEGATRSAKTNLDALPRLFVFDFGRAGGGAAAASGGGAGGPAPVRCPDGGERTDVCRNGDGGSSTRDTVYSNCRTVEDGITVTRNGMQRLDVRAPNCPIDPPPTIALTLTLEAYQEIRRRGSTELRSLEVDDTLVERFEPAGGSCTAGGVGFQNGTLTVDGSARLTCNNAGDPSCDPSLNDLRLTAKGLALRQAFVEPACDRTLVATGQLVVRNDAAGEDFSQSFDGFSMAESADGDALRIALNGRVFVDCIGPVEFVSKQEIRSPSDDFCPSSGALDVILGGGLGNATGVGAAAGGGADAFDRAPSAIEGGLREYALRAANGAVYQVLQNPSGNTELGGEDVRITTLVGSTEPPCSSDSSSGAIVGVARGFAFPAQRVRVSPTVPQAAVPCFNPNGAGGDGLVCIPDDGDCGDDCRCPRGGCLTFTIADGQRLDLKPLSGRVVDLPDSCDTIVGPSTFSFGTDTPTTRTTLCAARPSDGFTLSRGQSIVFAYYAAPAVAFATATGGFSIDTDGRNTRCPGTGVLTGIAFKSELGPARVTFDAGSVAFDVNADRVIDRELASCRQLSLAGCGAPSPTPTPTPVVAPRCLAAGNLISPIESSTSDRNNIVTGASCGDGGNTAPDRAFRFVPPATGCYRVDTVDTTGLAAPYDTLVYVRRGGDDCNGPELACNDNADATTAQSSLLVQLTGGDAVAVVVDGTAGAAGDFRLRVERSGPDCGTATPTPTPTQTATAPTPIDTPTLQPSPTNTPTPSILATATSTRTPDATPTATSSATTTVTITPTSTSSPTPTVTSTPTPTPVLGDGVFGPAMRFKVGTEPRSLAIGDFDLDGGADLAVANATSGDVSLLLGNGDGTFRGGPISLVGGRPVSVVTGRFGGEALDIAVADADADAVSVWIGTGLGGLGPAQFGTIGVGSRPVSIVSADFNFDGETDLATANFGSNDISIALAPFSGSVSRPTLGEGPIAIVAGRFNADQNLDLAVANYKTNDVSIFIGDGTGTFPSTPSKTLLDAAPSSLVAGDFDGNDTLDLVVLGTNGASFLPGNGDGTFGPRRLRSLSLLPAHLAAADFNHDDKLDLAVANFYGQVSVLFGRGDGRFDLPLEDYPVDTRPVFVAAADLDNDTDFDLVVSNSGSNDVSVLLNRPFGTETPTPTETPTVDEPTVTPGPEPVLEVVDNVSGERGGSLLVFPRVVANGTEDTTILIENVSNSAVTAHCFYVNGRLLSPGEPPGPLNPPLWQETDFKIRLIKQQPTHWVASRGRFNDPTDPACGMERPDCNDAGLDPGQIPPVVDFTGELVCVETADGFPIAGNHLSGRAVIETVAGGDARSYNALGLQGNDFQDGDNLLCMGTSENCPIAEYLGCPAEWMLAHTADGAADPKLGPASVSATRLTVVPCTQDFENQILATVVLQFRVTNEFEEQFSGSTSVQCWGEFAIGDVAEFFNAEDLGTSQVQTRITPVGAGGFLVVGESVVEIDGQRTSSMTNLLVRGQRAEGDVLVLPGQ